MNSILLTMALLTSQQKSDWTQEAKEQFNATPALAECLVREAEAFLEKHKCKAFETGERSLTVCLGEDQAKLTEWRAAARECLALHPAKK